MATGTNPVIPESGIRTIRLKMMAEGAIRPESRTRVDARMRVNMLRVRKLEHDWPLVFVTRVGQQLLAAGRRKHGMALLADVLLQVLGKVIAVAWRTSIVPGALKNHGARLFRHVACVTIKPNLLHMVVVQVKRSLRLQPNLRSGLGRRGLIF